MMIYSPYFIVAGDAMPTSSEQEHIVLDSSEERNYLFKQEVFGEDEYLSTDNFFALLRKGVNPFMKNIYKILSLIICSLLLTGCPAMVKNFMKNESKQPIYTTTKVDPEDTDTVMLSYGSNCICIEVGKEIYEYQANFESI